MKKSVCFILAILLFVGVLGCCLVFTDSGSFAYAATNNTYKFEANVRNVTLTSTAIDGDGNMRIRYANYFFGDSDIVVAIDIYSSPRFPINFHIGETNLSAEQLDTRDKIVQLFKDVINFIDKVDDVSNASYDGSTNAYGYTYPTSDVYRFNQAPSGTTLEIAKETYEMLQLAQEMYTETNGAYNPAVYRLVDLWGFSSRIWTYGRYDLPYDREFVTDKEHNFGYPLPEQKYIDAFSNPAFTDFSEDAVKLEERDGKYYVTKNVSAVIVDGVPYEQWIDLGGIAKGYAVDVAKSMIQELGIDRYDVDAGSSSMALGLSSSGGDIKLGVSDSFYEWAHVFSQNVLSVNVSDCSVSTSGQYIRKYKVNGVEYAHIIDGAKGAPAQTGVQSITVVVPDESGDFWATKGDCLTTALTVMGYDGVVEFIGGYLNDNGIKVVVQYEMLNGDKQLITNYEANEIHELIEDYGDFEWDERGFYVSNAISNKGTDNGNDNQNWWGKIDGPEYYKWILIGLGSLLGVGAIALIVYHFVRGKNRVVTNVRNAKKDKPFKMMDVLVYMLVALLIAVLFFSLVLDTNESDMQRISVFDVETNETLFIYNVARGEWDFNKDNDNGWTIEVEETDDGIEVTFTRDFNGEERYNVMRITTGRTPSVEMIDSICGFHQDCVRNFPEITRSGGAIVCSPNRLKIITE